jgi:membrane dipeptidase
MNRRTFLSAAIATGVAPLFIPSTRAAADPPSAENEKIASARQAALDILKPTQKQIDHGLALHAASTVVDGYAFSPRAAVDNAELVKLAEAKASDDELNDARESMPMTRYVTDPAERKEYLDAWRASGVTCVVQNAGEEGNDPLRLLKRLGRFTYVTDHLREHVSKAATADDVLAAKKAGRHCLCMTMNGVPLVQRWESIADELRYVRTFYELGVRMMHLTYNRRNPIGDGCGEPNDAGLSDFGRHAVAELNRVGVIVDCAHSGQKTSLDAAKASRKPMVASHSVAAAINPHIRAKSDEIIKAIADGGGLIGICCIPSFLGRGMDIAAFLDHIDYVAKKFGVDHVGIGTDVAYASRLKPNDVKAPTRSPQRTRWEALWPPGALGLGKGPKANASLSWTNWPLFTVGLVQRGYSDEEIQKIIGGNVLRVLRATEP